jgi:tubulin polyglutamylase TTLL5
MYTVCSLDILSVLQVHPNIPDFNLLWTGIHPKPHLLKAMTPYQRVNHFPR